MRLLLPALAVLLACPLLGAADAQIRTGESPFERNFGDIKFLDAYFGTAGEKLEAAPGDQNVPFTVIMANIGAHDITGVKGQLSMPIGFSSPEGNYMIAADSDTGSLAGETFALTFFVDVDEQARIGTYSAASKVDYSRLKESGLRDAFFDFDFKLTGDSVINMRALDPFLTSLQNNRAVIEISNSGTAPISGVDIELQNTQGTISSTSQSVTNTENVVIMNSNWDIGHLDPGTTKQIEFGVYVPESLKGDTLRAPMEITYFNAHGDRYTISRIVDFYVKGFIDASIYNVGVIDLSGMQTIIGEIINEGNEDALFGFVTIEPLGDSNIMPTTQFIDEIEVDSPVPFNVPIQFDGEPRYGEHTVNIIVRYKDDVRTETFITHEETIFLEEASDGEEPGVDYMQLMILPVVAGVGLLAFRRMRRRKDDS